MSHIAGTRELSELTENEMQWAHKRLIADNDGHRWNHRQSQSSDSPQLKSFTFTHLCALITDNKRQTKSPQFETSNKLNYKTEYKHKRLKGQQSKQIQQISETKITTFIESRQKNLPQRQIEEWNSKDVQQIAREALRSGNYRERMTSWYKGKGDIRFFVM